jgi:hypothetical protein
LATKAEKLYNESIKIFREHNMTLREITALRDLQVLYVAQDKIENAEQINQRLTELAQERI